MPEIKCPKCGEVFTVDESGYVSILKQVRDNEFKKELEAAISERLETESIKIKASDKDEINNLKLQISALNSKLLQQENDKKIAVSDATSSLKDEINKLNLKVEAMKEDKLQTERVLNEQIDFYNKDLAIEIRETVDKVEKMKVCTCLNPLHTFLAVSGCILGYTLIADEMKDKDLLRLVKRLGYEEGLPVVVDPGIIKPKTLLMKL